MVRASITVCALLAACNNPALPAPDTAILADMIAIPDETIVSDMIAAPDLACVGNGGDCPRGQLCDPNNGCIPGCIKDDDCNQGSPSPASQGLVRCDVDTKQCVQCLPANDNCPPGFYCANVACTPGCKTNADCLVGNPSPASLGIPFCNVGTNQCVACLTGADCGIGCSCINNSCKVPCIDDSECGIGSTCCGSTDCDRTCIPATTAANCGACENKCASDEDCCGTSCTKLNTLFNCGGCGISCTSGQNCCNAKCIAASC